MVTTGAGPHAMLIEISKPLLMFDELNIFVVYSMEYHLLKISF